MDLVSLPAEEPLPEFITNSFTTYQNNSFAKIEKFTIYTNVWKNVPFTQEDIYGQY